MAKGTDLDEFRLVSEVGSGLKREFSFALNNQSEFDGSGGRTRGKNTQGDSPGGNKRFRSSIVEGEESENVVIPLEENQVDLVESAKEEVMNDLEKSSVDDGPERNPVLHVEESVREESMMTDLKKSPVAELHVADSVKEDGGIGAKTLMVVDIDSDIQKVSLESSPRRFTRSASKLNPESVEIARNDLQESLISEKCKSGSDSLITGEVSKLDLVKSPIAEEPKTTDLEKSTNVDDSNGSAVVDGAKTIIEDGGIASAHPDDNCENPNALPEKPMRRITRSASKPKDEPKEVSGTATSTSTSSGSSVVSEDACKNEEATKDDVRMSDAVSPMTSPQNSNLEMKMSKKIALTKFPSNVRELLETGLLEGLNVKYLFTGNKKENLTGTIKDHGVICSCSSCKGCNVISLYEFERHAGSSKKHPSKNMYLENGRSLHDVMNACKYAPVDTLEATIKSFIDYSPVKATVCRNCKGSLPATQIAMSASLCDSCLESDKPEASPTCTTVSKTRLSKRVATPVSSSRALVGVSPPNNSSKGKITRKDLRLHKLVFEEDGLPEGTWLGYFIRGEKLLEGYKKGFGIFCSCCQTEVSPSQFEAHAGWATRRKPYLNIYTSNGVSLHELSVSLSRGRKFSPNENDDLCNECHEFGDLVLCDGCPRAFHKECANLSSIPRGKWYCKCCLSMYQREKACEYNENAKAAGRVSGVDLIEQITKRCIRIVETLAPEAGGCALCRRHGFSKLGFGPETVILCDQCEKEYHVGCLKEHNMADLKELPEGNWFCCAECCRIHTALHKLVLFGPQTVTNSLTYILKKKQNNVFNLEVKWRFLSGKMASSDSKSVLSKAVAIFHDCFDPILDSRTGRDLIPDMVYGRDTRDQEFGGMYCAVMTVDSCVVSVGLLRIFGKEIAELPLVATNSDYQGKGYFQSLFICIERLLAFLKVKTLVLPAAEEAKSIWTDKFGFKNMSQDEVAEFRTKCQMMTFQGTSMLKKPVPQCRIIDKKMVKGSD